MICFLWLLFPAADLPKLEDRFSQVEIESSFEWYLRTNPLLMEVSGAKIIRLLNGNQVVIAVASTVLNDRTAEDRLRAEKVCRIKALASVVAEKEGVQVWHVEKIEEKTVIVRDGQKETGNNVMQLLQFTKTETKGVAEDMPVVGRWRSKSGEIVYFALGAILDKHGKPIPAKKRE